MLGALLVFPLFFFSCLAGFFRPYWGLLGFYAFVFLEPEWNWRWVISRDWNFQKYIGACLLLGVLLHGFRGNQFKGWLGYAVCGLVGFLGLAWVAASQTIDEELTFFYMDTITKVVIVAIVSARIVDTPKKCLGLLAVVMICQGYNAYQINEYYFKTGIAIFAYRPWGYKGDNNLYSIFTIPAMAASIGLAIHGQKMWHRGVASLIWVLQLHQVMLMASRGCMIGGLFMFSLCLWFMPKTAVNVRAAVAAVLVGLALAGPSVVKEFASSFETDARQRDSSAESRFKLWRAGFLITKDHPLLGVGPYAGQVMVPAYEPAYANKYKKGLHNLVFELSTGCGVPATLCYFTWLLVPWWIAYKTYKAERDLMDDATAASMLAMVIGVPGYLLSSMFSSGALLESSYVLVACGAASVYCWRNREQSPELLADDDEIAEPSLGAGEVIVS